MGKQGVRYFPKGDLPGGNFPSGRFPKVRPSKAPQAATGAEQCG